jgi:hypothetical protein
MDASSSRARSAVSRSAEKAMTISSFANLYRLRRTHSVSSNTNRLTETGSSLASSRIQLPYTIESSASTSGRADRRLSTAVSSSEGRLMYGAPHPHASCSEPLARQLEMPDQGMGLEALREAPRQVRAHPPCYRSERDTLRQRRPSTVACVKILIRSMVRSQVLCRPIAY